MAEIESREASIQQRRLIDIQNSTIAFKERNFVIAFTYFTLGVLGLLGGYFIWTLTQESLFLISIFTYCAFVVALFISAVKQPANRAGWPYLLANKESIFIPNSSNGEYYLEIPWHKVRGCRAGEYSLNIRGLVFEINEKRMSQRDLNVLASSLNRNTMGDYEVATPTGSLNRTAVIEKLALINPELNTNLD